MSPLAEAASDYLALRRALGFKLAEAGRLLPRLVAHLDAVGAETLTVADALAWSASLGRDVSGRLAAIRGFARYLQALEPAHEVPPCGLVPARRRRAVPHLYSEAEILALMAAARRLEPPLRAATTELVIGLLAVSGMRVGEVLALDVGDVDWDAGVATVRAAKFHKDRLVPLSASTLAALDRFRRGTRRRARSRSAALFVGAGGGRLGYGACKAAFDRVLAATGLVAASGRRPRMHDFRHRFAVVTVTEWYRAGADVHALLPRLSTYLGHVDPAATYWYLSAAPELLALAAERLEQHQEVGR